MKPIVHFRRSAKNRIELNLYGAWLMRGTTDHPKLNNLGGMVLTSKVVRIISSDPKTGRVRAFETENTIYKEAK